MRNMLLTKKIALKATIFMLFLLTFINKINAQYDITVGTGTRVNSSNRFPCPLQDTFTGSRAQYLFKASELNALGMDSGAINSIAFFVTKLNSYFGTVEGLSVKMGTTSAAVLGATTWINNLKTVYTPKDWTVTLGRNVITFDTTFDWDGIQNLVLEVCNGSAIGTSTSNPSVLQTVLTYNASRSYAASGSGSLCASTSTTNVDSSQKVRPVTAFNWTPTRFCDNKPVVGTVTASSLSVCPSVPLTLTSTGGTYASLITYQWQRLNPATSTWEDTNPLDNGLSLTLFQDTTNSYRLKAFCTLTGDSAFSNVVTVTTPKVPGGNQYIINKNHTGNVWPLSDTFKSFSATVAAMNCGIKSAVTFTVLPGSGPYNEQMVVNGRIINSSTTNTITYVGNGETISFNPSTNSRAVIKLKGAKYFTFDSLNVNAGNGNYSFGFQFQNNADTNTVKRCTIKSAASGAGYTALAASAGIVIGGTDASAIALDVNSLCDHINITNNQITGGASGIVLAGGSGGENTYIVVNDNTIKDFYQHGVYLNGTYNITVEHNIISRPNTTVSPATPAAVNGVYVTNLNRSLRIVRNRIHSPFANQTTSTFNFNGINLDLATAGTSPAVDNEFHLANNLIYNIQGNGLQNGVLNNNTSNVQLYHNTIALDDELGNPTTAAATTRCYSQTGTPSSITIVNNLFTIKRGGTSNKHCIYLGTPVAANFKDLSFNNYVNDAASGSGNYIGYWSTNRLTLSDWIAASNESSALNIQPVYAEPVTPNMDTAKYNPTNASLDAKGKAVYEKVDINGSTLTRIDIGCYEFVPPPCIPSNLNGYTLLYVNGSKVVSDTTICENIPLTLKLKIIGATGSATVYQWERAINDSNNLASPFGPALISSDTTVNATGAVGDSAYYFRCKISCTGVDYYTDWRKISVRPAMITGEYQINLDSVTRFIPGAANGMFHNYTEAIYNMRYCGVTGNTGNVVFKVQQPTSASGYAEQILVDSIKGVTVNRQVVFKGNNTTISLPSTTPSTTERAVIKLQKAHFINFDSLVVDASQATTFGYGFQLLNNADSNTITNCSILASTTQTSVGFAGIVVNANGNATPTANGNSFCDGNKFDNNNITGGYYGITLVGGAATATPNTYNNIINNKITDFYNTGLYLSGTNNTLVEGNTFSRPTRTPLGIGYGINLTASPTLSSRISKNRFTNFFGSDGTSAAGAYGINFNNVDASLNKEVYVVNNAFYNMGGTGNLYPLYNTSSDFVLYYHNSISIDDTTAAVGATSGFYQTGAATGISIKNNIIHIKRAGLTNKFCINFQTVGTGGTTFESNNNDFAIYSGFSNNYIGNYGTSTTGFKKSLADWKAASAQDANSVSYEPLYVDVKNGDLHPQFYLIDNLGINNLATDDILGVARPNGTPRNSDMGAFEFTAPICATPLVTGTPLITPNTSLCLEEKINLNLVGNSPLGPLNFQWQDSLPGVPGWNNLGPLLYSPSYDTITSIRNYYRCIVTCASTNNSVVSPVDSVPLNNLLPAGVYTIDSTLPCSAPPYQPGDNFIDFNCAIAAMGCGIRGNIIFDVKPGANNVYNEQVTIPYIKGANANATVTFRGYQNNIAGTTVSFAGTATKNYVVRFDSANYVTFSNLNIENTNSTYGRVVDFVNKSSNSKLLNCNITTPITTTASINTAAVFANQFKGSNIVIKGNTINNGSNGIYFAGTSQTAGNLTNKGHIIDSNTINKPYGSGMYLQFTDKINVTRNNVSYHSEAATGSSGIFASYCDSGMILKNNNVTIDSVNGAIFGIQVVNSRNKRRTGFTEINGNQIYANNGNAGKVIGLAIITSDSLLVKNNVIGINSAGNASYGLQNVNNVANTTVLYYNNTVQVSLADTNSVAAQLTQASGGNFTLLNNIFSNVGGGKAMFMSPSSNFSSNYNMLYSAGKNLVNTGTTPASYFQNIIQWRKASGLDKWSIVYKPAFISVYNLQPDVSDSNVWAIQGRGLQIKGNITDINGVYRSDALTKGVPDLGAYEFHPNVKPPVLPAVPAIPAANTRQAFYFGSDTVMTIKWDINPPASCDIRRYSGVVGNGITAQGRCDSMYFYVSVELPNNNVSKGNIELRYLDPWLGSIPTCGYECQLGVGKTDKNNVWVVNPTSNNNRSKKFVYETDLKYFDRFTGLLNQYLICNRGCSDTSNAGQEFWTAYPANQLDGQETYKLYIAARDDDAEVTVTVPNNPSLFSWSGTVLAGNVQIVNVPKATGLRKQNSGLYPDAIQILSSTPVVAYAHCYGAQSSGASMLMPKCTWGYEYKMLAKHQNWGFGSFSSYFVVASEDSTRIAFNNVVTPSIVPIQDTVTLMAGQWYQVLAANGGDDLVGSSIKSVPNNKGVCFPFAMFSTDTRTTNTTPCTSGGDFVICQNFPATAWGKRYLTAPTTKSNSPNGSATDKNLFRISLIDANQQIFVNNTQIYPSATSTNSCVESLNVSSTIIPGTTIPAFVEFVSGCTLEIRSNKKMMVAQFMSGACGTGEVSDPDQAFLSPIEQGINKVNFYRNDSQQIATNTLVLIGLTKDTPTLREAFPIQNLAWSHIYNHWKPGYSVYVKQWPVAARRQVSVESESQFTAITYGQGSFESYMYNAGTNILNFYVPTDPPCNEGLADSACSPYTCAGTRFRIKTKIADVLPDSIRFYISNIPGLNPSKDVVLAPPYNKFIKDRSVRSNGDSVWTFELDSLYTISNPGQYTLIMKMWNEQYEGCDKSLEWRQVIQVLPAPRVDFLFSPNLICPNTNVTFTADSTDRQTGISVKNFSWTSNPYGISYLNSNQKTISYFYATAGVDTVKLRVKTEQDNCVGDTSHIVTINPNPVVNVVKDSIHTCSGGNVTFNVQSPLTGAVYTLYDAPTGGNVIQVDTVFTFNNVTADATYYVGCVSATGCTSVDRKAIKIKGTQLPIATATPTTITACIGTSATFNVTNKQPNVHYTWFDAATGGTQLDTGISYTIANVIASATYYLEASENGCASATRFAVNVIAATPPSLAVVKDTLSVCAADAATFSILNPDATVTYNWYTVATGGTATVATNYTINPATTSGSYWVSATSANGCTTPRLKVDLTVKTRPVVTVVSPDSVTLCKGLRQTFCVLNPLTGAKYKWYNQSSGGVLVQADSSCFTTPPLVNGDTTYYVDGEKDGCVSFTRATVKIKALQELDTTSVTGTKVETNFIRFDWTAVLNATGYKITVTVNGGTPTTTTYGPGTLTYLISNLLPGDTAWATVVALGSNPCQNSTSRPAYGKTVLNTTYYPNVFTPNGDGKNDKIVICGSSFKDIKYAVYNQWGEKIWEVNGLVATDAKGCYLLWDGTQRGVLQPVGVYMFTSKITFLDGKVEEKKGTINLIR